MPSSQVLPATAAAINVQSPTTSDSEEYKYEEIEIEQEIKVEEKEEKVNGEELSSSIHDPDDEKVRSILSIDKTSLHFLFLLINDGFELWHNNLLPFVC